MILFSYGLSVFKSMILVYVCIRILDLKLKNVYENGQKGLNWNEKKIKDQTVTWNWVKGLKV